MKEHREQTGSPRKTRWKLQMPRITWNKESEGSSEIKEKKISVRYSDSPYMEDFVSMGETQAVQEYMQENIRTLTEPYEIMFSIFLRDRIQAQRTTQQAIQDMSDDPNLKDPLFTRFASWGERESNKQRFGSLGKIQDNSPHGFFSIDYEISNDDDEEEIIPIAYQDQQVKVVFDEEGKIIQVALMCIINNEQQGFQRAISLPQDETPNLFAFAQSNFPPPEGEIPQYMGMISFSLDDNDPPRMNLYKNGYTNGQPYAREKRYEESHIATGSYDLNKETFVLEHLSDEVPRLERRQALTTDDFFELLRDTLSLIPDHY